MISSIGQNNNVQIFSAVNALRSSSAQLRATEKDNNIADIKSESTITTSAPKSLLDRIDVADIRKCAEYVGEYNITDEDIKYGMMYGRSVIAEFLC